MSLMHADGSSVQDEAGALTINSPATVEAVPARCRAVLDRHDR